MAAQRMLWRSLQGTQTNGHLSSLGHLALEGTMGERFLSTSLPAVEGETSAILAVSAWLSPLLMQLAMSFLCSNVSLRYFLVA